MPLIWLLGGARQNVLAYGSGGFTNYSTEQLLEQLTHWADDGFTAVKMKIGRDTAFDLKRVAAVREELGDDIDIYVDANGAYERKLALRLSHEFEEMGVTWFEEPVSSDDLEGLKSLVDKTELQIAAGEYIYAG